MRERACLIPLLAVILLAALLTGAPAAVAAAQAGKPGLAVTAEPGSVPVGGAFRLVLTYSLPPGARVGDPPEIRGAEALSVVKRSAVEGRIVLTVLAESLEPMRIGPLELGYADAAGRKGFVRSGVLTVAVTSNLKGGEELAPIKGIIPTANRWLKPALYLGIAALLLAALAGAWHAWKKLKRGGDAAVPEEAPHARAEREIEALLEERLFEQGRRKEFYFRFTEIVKGYLEGLRGFPAAECTTEEIAARLGDADRPVLSLLRAADLVKFADHEATPAKRDDDVSAFLAYVDITAPRGTEGESPRSGSALAPGAGKSSTPGEAAP